MLQSRQSASRRPEATAMSANRKRFDVVKELQAFEGRWANELGSRFGRHSIPQEDGYACPLCGGMILQPGFPCETCDQVDEKEPIP